METQNAKIIITIKTTFRNRLPYSNDSRLNRGHFLLLFSYFVSSTLGISNHLGWGLGGSFFCARAWTQNVIRPLINASGYSFPAWKTKIRKIIIKNDHSSIANRCYKANDFWRSFLVVFLTYSGRTTVWLMYSTLLVKIHFISYIYVGKCTKDSGSVEDTKCKNNN